MMMSRKYSPPSAVSLFILAFLLVAPGARVAAKADEGVGAALAAPFTAVCYGCNPCGGYTGHITDGSGNWAPGHGSHHGLCWEGATCDDKHAGPCDTFASIPLSELLEEARQAAISDSNAAFRGLPADFATLVVYNERRQAIQVKACDGSGNIVANLPIRWATNTPEPDGTE